MRDRRYGTVMRMGLLAATALATAACAHNDVLVFGTSTTIGLNIESVSAEGAPSIVLGYEREEAVWMPLVLNGADSRLSLCAGDGQGNCASGSVPVSQAMYRSEITERNGRVTRDTYSVFASLGARFSGNADQNGVGAGGGLAQFFATGNAAVNVTQNEALVTALKVESAAGAAAQAAAVRDSGPLSAEALARVEARVNQAGDDLDFVLACTTTQGKDWATIVNASSLSTGRKALLAPLAPGERQAAIEGDPDRLGPLATSAQAAGCTR